MFKRVLERAGEADNKEERQGMFRTSWKKKESLLIWFVYFVLLSLAFSTLLVRGSFFLSSNVEYVVSMVPDDACYFYKIARNVVQGNGLSFDGINLTNGFQPLWLYALLPLAWAMRDANPEVFFRAALFYQLVILLISGILLFYALCRITSKGIALICTSIFYVFCRYFFSNGMETGVLVLSLSALLALAAHYRIFLNSVGRLTTFTFGLLLGAVLLSRLDMIFLIFTLYSFLVGYLWMQRKESNRVKALYADVLMTIFGFLSVVLPYFLYNYLVFGDIMPMSGQLKNSFPRIVSADFFQKISPRNMIAASVSLCFILTTPILFRVWHKISIETKYLFAVALVGSVTVLLLYLNTALFIKWGVFYWHFAFYYYMLPLVLAAWLSVYRDSTSVPKYLPIDGFAIVLTLIITMHILLSSPQQYRRSSEWHAQAYRAAIWARQNTLPEDVFALSDAGVFGFFSERSVINLDGLVNNLQYQETIRRKELNKYIQKNKVKYIVVHSFKLYHDHHNKRAISGNYEYLDLTYISHLYNLWSDPIRVYRADEVYRSEPYYDGPYRTVFLIWRLRHDAHQR